MENFLENPRSELAQARLAAALEKAREYMLKSRAKSTWRAYQSDWRQFEAYCRNLELPTLPVTKYTLRAFLSDQAADGIAPSTLQRRLAAIRLVNAAAGHTFTDDFAIEELMSGIRRDWERPKVPKTAAVATDLMRMADTVDPESHMGLRNRAVLLFGFAGAFRRSELVGIAIEHLSYRHDVDGAVYGVDVTLPKSKTDPEGLGQTVSVPTEPGSPYCPVQALRDWLTVAGVTSGAVFRRMFRHDTIGRTAMSAQSVALVVKEHAKRAGLEAAHYSGHSLRRGFLSSAAQEDKNLFKMAGHSRHKSFETLRQYVEDRQRYKNHAGEGLLRSRAVTDK